MATAIARDGTKLHFEVHGSGHRDLLLLHGMGDSSTWRLLLAQLEPQLFRIVTCDWRGHGKSGGGADTFTFEQLNLDLLTVLDAAEMETCTAIGFSGGCKNAVWLAAEAPKRIEGLVLVAPPGMGLAPVPREAIQYFADVLERTRRFPAEFEAWFTEKSGDEKANVERAFAATPRPVLEASAELWIYTSIVDQAARVKQPTAIVAAAADAIYSPDYQRRTTLAALPHAEMIIVDAGHFIPQEAPKPLATIVRRLRPVLPRA